MTGASFIRQQKTRASWFEATASLGLSAQHAADLRDALLEAARADEATATDQDEYGQRFVVDFTMNGPAGSARIRSSWIVRTDEDFARLTSCYVL